MQTLLVPATCKACVNMTFHTVGRIRAKNDAFMLGSSQVADNAFDGSFVRQFWVLTESGTLVNSKQNVWP